MNNKITIIEGPTPEFQLISNSENQEGSLTWANTIMEGPFLYDTALTQLRTFDSQKLLNRCKNAWSEKQTMYLEYKDQIGLRREDAIIAARALKVEEGDILMLWVRQELFLEDEDEFEEDSDDLPDDLPF
jgi:hypothetical protein